MKKLYLILIIITMSFPAGAIAQDILNTARISGNFQIDAQYYQKDSLIDAEEVPEKMLSNSFLNLNYELGNFRAGMRYEAYLNPILGIDERYEGSGIAYRYLEFNSEQVAATVGNFYEQFGSGLIFRAYEERALGYDNAVDGAKVKFRPVEGIEFTGIIGKQRSFWSTGEGIVRGGDLNFNVNTVFEDLMPESLNLTLGGSVVSRYQADKDNTYILPENVLAYSTRFSLTGDVFMLDGEYAYKYNDPNATNAFNFNPGKGLIINGTYFGDGIGASLSFHGIDNMDYRSDRYATGQNLNTNYIPPISRQQAYRLATLYPYATQLNGEIGMQAELTYTLPRKTLLGGDYGTTLMLNYSRIQSIDSTMNEDGFTYESHPFAIGDIFSSDNRLFFEEINFEINRKISKNLKAKLAVIHSIYDKDVMEYAWAVSYGKVTSTAIVGEITYKLAPKHSLRIEAQHLSSENELPLHKVDNINGNWALLLAEYTIAPQWYFTIFDEYNYGNEFEDRQLHYLNASVAYVHNSSRVSFGYGRQRGGVLCVGGVCREVEASNGFTLSISSTF